ncbi:hypothetical protein AB0K08_05125 [Citricoccus sp. NPDC055426]|uniref:lipopolysaccharide biosynthesis protein n=1 Tax=Citricoccus sp. NPDC055426 TaxID=3155536 RepID=UPI003442684F
MPETGTVQVGRGRRRQVPGPSEWNSPVVRGAMALTINSVVSAVLGLVFWILAARLLPVEQIGLGMATVATITTVANLGQLNLYQTAGILLSGGQGSRRRVLDLSGLVIAATLLLGTGAALLWALTRLGDDLVTTGALFVACAVAWALYSLKDGLLVGLRGFASVPMLNTLYGVLKVGVLILLAAAWGAQSIVAATFVPVLVILPVAVWVIFRRAPETGSPAAPLHAVDRKFIGVDYLGFVCLQLSTTLLPLLILSWAGPHAAGVFAVVWLLVVMLDTLAHNAGIPLASEAARAPHRARRLSGIVSRWAFVLVAAAVAATLLLADVILGFYGEVYADEGATALRIFALATLARCYTVLTMAVIRAARRAAVASSIEALHLVVLLSAAAYSVPSHGVTGMAWAWLAAQLVTAVACWFARPKGGQ